MNKLHKSNTRTRADDLLTFAKELFLLVCISAVFSIILISGIAENI